MDLNHLSVWAIQYKIFALSAFFACVRQVFNFQSHTGPYNYLDYLTKAYLEVSCVSSEIQIESVRNISINLAKTVLHCYL
jgi:hypothetical protein